MSVIKFIISNLGRYKRRFWLSIVAGLINSFAGVSIPLLLASFTTSGLSSAGFWQLMLWLIVAIVVSLACSWYLRRHGEAVAYGYPNYLRLKYFRELEQLPLGQLAKHHTGYTLSMVNQVASRVSPILMDWFWTFTGVIANVGLLIYFTAIKALGLTFLNVAIFIVFVIISTILARNMTQLANSKNRQDAVFSQYFVDFMSNLGTIKRLGIRQFADSLLTAKGEASNLQVQKFQNAHSNRWLLLHTIYFIANFVTIGYMLYGIAHGTVPVSLLILFVSFYGNIRYIIERIAENIITFTETRVYIKNLDEILTNNEQPYAGQKPAKQWRSIELKDTSYQHADNAVVVHIPDLTIKWGDAVCIYGQSGEGKSTVMNILANYLPTKDGSRQVDGLDYSKLNRTWFADELAFISQETELFNLSLRDNLALGQQIADDKLWQLLKDLDLELWAQGLDKQLDTIVGEKGLRLSAGQKQRINLARGILLNRSLYLLDEPTSHLDETTERTVVKAIQKYLKGKTLVVVTHRPEIKKICNKFYKMSRHAVLPE